MAYQVESITREGRDVAGFFKDISLSEANSIRRTISGFIETHAVEVAIFDINTSARSDESLGNRLCLMPISEKDVNEEEEVSAVCDVVGPLKVTCNHIVGIPWSTTVNLCTLQEGERLKFKVIAKKGKGINHTKWSPGVSPYLRVDEERGGIYVLYGEVDKMSPEEVFRKAIENVEIQKTYNKANKYFVRS